MRQNNKTKKNKKIKEISNNMAEPNFTRVLEEYDEIELMNEFYEEKSLEEAYERTFKENKKVPKNWGIQKKDLQKLKAGGISYSPIQGMFVGIHNLYVPDVMLDVENPAEILAQYYAAGILKQSNQHINNESIPRTSFSELAKYLNQVAYSNPVFAKHSHSLKRRFSVNPGDLQERLSGLDGSVKRDFFRSFFGYYNASDFEVGPRYQKFHDPRNPNKYVEQIYDYFSRRFEFATKCS